MEPIKEKPERLENDLDTPDLRKSYATLDGPLDINNSALSESIILDKDKNAHGLMSTRIKPDESEILSASMKPAPASILKSRFGQVKKAVQAIHVFDSKKNSKDEEKPMPIARLDYQIIDKSKRAKLKDEEEEDAKRVKPQHNKYIYKDNRMNYFQEHDALISKDIDSNIDDILGKIMVKHNILSKAIGKIGTKSRLPKKG